MQIRNVWNLLIFYSATLYCAELPSSHITKIRQQALLRTTSIGISHLPDKKYTYTAETHTPQNAIIVTQKHENILISTAHISPIFLAQLREKQEILNLRRRSLRSDYTQSPHPKSLVCSMDEEGITFSPRSETPLEFNATFFGAHSLICRAPKDSPSLLRRIVATFDTQATTINYVDGAIDFAASEISGINHKEGLLLVAITSLQLHFK